MDRSWWYRRPHFAPNSRYSLAQACSCRFGPKPLDPAGAACLRPSWLECGTLSLQTMLRGEPRHGHTSSGVDTPPVRTRPGEVNKVPRTAGDARAQQRPCGHLSPPSCTIPTTQRKRTYFSKRVTNAGRPGYSRTTQHDVRHLVAEPRTHPRS